MDKLVRRVTVVEGSGENRQAKVVYKAEGEDRDESYEDFLPSFERSVRHLLKADLIRAQEAYDRHVESASKGKTDWIFDAPENLRKAFVKAEKEARKARPDNVEREVERKGE